MSIQSEISRLEAAKSDLKSAMESLGVPVPAETKIDGYAALVTGTAPYIGENGNWFVAGKDTGVKAQGPSGDPGTPGKNGSDGKSAYAYAQDGGYTGSEQQFYTDLASMSGVETVLASM